MTRITSFEANQLYVTTRCRSVTQFVAVFKRYVDDDCLFVPKLDAHPAGLDLSFVVALADGTQVLRGSARVRESWRSADNAFRLPGMLLCIESLNDNGWDLFRRMLPQRAGTLLAVAPADDDASEPDSDRVPQLIVSDQVTSRSDPDPDPDPDLDLDLDPDPRPRLARASTSPPRTSGTRSYFRPAPKKHGSRVGEPIATPSSLDEDLFTLPTRVAMAPPRTLLREPETRPARRRSYRAWTGATLLAILASVGVVRATATEAEATEPVVIQPRQPAVVVERRESAWPIVGDGPCRLSVSAVPAGSTVELDGSPQGVSPVTLATTCGQHRVEVSHPTHATLTVWGTLVAGQPETVDLTLARRIDAVWVVTRPAGAILYIDGQRVGRTPRRLDVLGHVPLTLEVRKPGYRTVVEHVYTITPRNRVHIELTRAHTRSLGARR